MCDVGGIRNNQSAQTLSNSTQNTQGNNRDGRK
jgi:hypothetical protein